MNLKGLTVTGLSLVLACAAVVGNVEHGLISHEIRQAQDVEINIRLKEIKRLNEQQWKATFAEKTGVVHNDDISEYFYTNRRFRQQVSLMMAEGKHEALTDKTYDRLNKIAEFNAANATFFNVFCSEFKCLAVMLNRTITERTDDGSGVEINVGQISVPEICELMEHQGCDVNSYTVSGADEKNILVDNYLFLSFEYK